MFEEKIITKVGYIETTLPFAYYNELLSKINEHNFTEEYNYSLAGQIKDERALSYDLYPDEIKEIILTGCRKYINTFGHSYFFNNNVKNYDLKFESSWINFQKKGEYNPIHWHSGDLVFVIWLKIPYNLQDEYNHPSSIDSNTKCASKFQFTNIVNPFTDSIKYDIDVDKSYEGKLVIFHARMEHLVYPFFTSDDYRISMSGNLNLVKKT